MADAPAWRVKATKKGDWPIIVEKRKHHTVTCIRNVTGAELLCTELQDALGAGGCVRGNVVELQGRHTDRCVAFLVAHLRHVSGLRGALLPQEEEEEATPLEAPASRHGVDGAASMQSFRAPAPDLVVAPTEKRKPRWDATRKLIGKHEPARATTAATDHAILSGVCPLDFSLLSFRDACSMWWRCTCPKPDPQWLEPGDDAAPFYDPKVDGTAEVARDVCEVFTLSTVSRGEAPLKSERARKMEVRATARQAERERRAVPKHDCRPSARGATPQAWAKGAKPLDQAWAPRPAGPARRTATAAKRHHAWLDADDIDEGLGRYEDWSEEVEDVWDDDAAAWQEAEAAASGAEATRDIADWNAAVRAAGEERDRALVAPVEDFADASSLSNSAVLARADALGWSETYVGLLMDALGARFETTEPTLWRKVLALVSSGADAHDAVLAALADVLRPAWACAACTLQNEGAADFCGACATPRGGVDVPVPPTDDDDLARALALSAETPPPPPARPPAPSYDDLVEEPALVDRRFDSVAPPSSTGEWTCAVCTLQNRAEYLACDVCGAERDAA